MSDERHTHPSIEEVAAFAEGRLEGEERLRVLEHLVGCDDCRELLAEVLATTEELEQADGAEAPVDFAREAGRRRRRWLGPQVAAAAVVAIGVGIGLYWNDLRQTPPSRQEFLAQMPPAEQLAPNIWGGVAMRGEGSDTELARRSAELGALLVDLDVALAGRATERATEIMRRMATILDGEGLMESDVQTLRSLAGESDPRQMSSASTKELPGIEQRIRQGYVEFQLDLGSFVEQARLAALTGKAEFAASRRSRSYLRWVLAQHEEPLTPAAREGLERLLVAELPAQQAEAAADARRALVY